MRRRKFLQRSALAAAAFALAPSFAAAAPSDWLARWKGRIEGGMRERFCDTATGEDIGWLMSPFLNGFYYGYSATKDVIWIDRLADWTDSWLKRGVKDPSGCIGWPKDGEGIGQGGGLFMDSLLGEAMGFRPVVLAARMIQQTPELNAKFGSQAQAWLALAEKTFEKWDSFDCWREVQHGGLWVVPAFGIDSKTGRWTDGYAQRATAGFSNPDNKENEIARWMLAMWDATEKPVYRDRAEKWFRLMRSRMKTQQDGKYFVWNYWEPAGPWDYNPDGTTRHWVGVHPNGGYYGIDVEAIVDAYEHGLVFTRDDINELVATNREFMWNQQMKGARFRRIDAGEPDARWKDTPGKLWAPLVFYDDTLREVFVRNFDPASWDGLSVTPWFLAHP